jgi:hypothetical protein
MGVVRACWLVTLVGCSFHPNALTPGTDAPGASDAPDDAAPDSPPTGMLAGTPASADTLTNVDLTMEGTIDWAEWGMTTATDFNHKATGGGKIANATVTTATTVYGYGNNYMGRGNDGFTWTDGTPTAMQPSPQYSGIYVAGQGKGLSTTVPAGTTTRTLRLYVGAYNATGTLTAHLSDGSAPDYTDGSLGNTSTSWAGVYTLVFRSIDPNATLNVRWVQNTVGGDVNWSAASLY